MDALALSPARDAPVAAFGIAVTASVALHLGALGLIAPFAYGVAPIVVEPPQRLEVVLVEAARPSAVRESAVTASAMMPAGKVPHPLAKSVVAPSTSRADTQRAVAAAAAAPPAQGQTPAVAAATPSQPEPAREAAASASRAPDEPLRVEPRPAPLAAPSPVHVAAPAPSSPSASSPAAGGTSAVASNAGSLGANTGSGSGASTAVAAAPAATAVAYLDTPPPAYPESARRDGLQGLTVVEVLVSKTGAPLDVRVAKTSGVATLDGAAVAGVRKWRFTPATRDHEPIDARITIPIRFRLDGEG